MAVRDELLHQWLPASGLRPAQLSQILDVMRDFGTVRKWAAPCPDETPGSSDATWMVGRSFVVLATIELFEELIYSNGWDGRYTDAIKSKLRVTDFLDYESVRTALDEVGNQIKAERLQQQGSADSAADGASGPSSGAAPPPPPGTGIAASTTPGAANGNATTEGVDNLSDTDKDHWERYIDKLIRTYVQLIPDQKTNSALELLIKQCPLANLAYTQEGITARRKVLRATPGSAHQVEWCHAVANSKISLPERQRLHYEGSTGGDAPMTEKKTDSAIVPACYRPMPLLFYFEMNNAFFAKLVVDITPISGVFAWACLLSRVGYVGICFAQEHAEMLFEYLKDKLKEEMSDATSKLYNRDYAKAIGKLETPTEEHVKTGRGAVAAAAVAGAMMLALLSFSQMTLTVLMCLQCRRGRPGPLALKT
ncbi:unnamed protein product [Prorocentrum cordatum]|uniref:Uncharacterized protein n=1 Tax=Prorocentrum cordatum TaxID=2364126 RepID=A0ABN9UA56_9DINO|nr:unnamed protein product [Polarella glacialis]